MHVKHKDGDPANNNPENLDLTITSDDDLEALEQELDFHLLPDHIRAKLYKMEEERNEMRKALIKAIVPLEVLHILDKRGWRHPILQKRWRQMVTPKLRENIAASVLVTRNALTKTPHPADLLTADASEEEIRESVREHS